MKRIPDINLQYWALIISATTLGETAGDLISQSMNLGYGGGTIALLILLLIALTAELSTKTQHPFLYWTVITLASTTGTTISDYISRTMELGYIWDTVILTILLILIFGIWRLATKGKASLTKLSIQTEFLYWMAILTSSTLGTALGDLLAHDTPLGFGGGTIFLLALLLMVIFLTLFTRVSREVCYWLAIVITHPIGATMGDYMTKPEGMNLGNVTASAYLVVVFVLIIVAGKFIKTKG